jgi:hypothetical protein
MHRAMLKKKNNKIIKDDTDDEISIDENKEEKNNKEFYSRKKIFIQNAYKFLIKTFNFLFKTLIVLFKVSGIYLLWICLHYFSAHLYIKFCVPNTIIGFFMSPFMIATPHCQGLRWIVYNAAGIINNMWILIGTWIYSLIWIFNHDTRADTTGL